MCLESTHIMSEKQTMSPYLKVSPLSLGVVDSEDLPLHISREQLQDSRLIKRISKSLVKKLVSHFDSLSKRDKKKFEEFYKEYNVFLKEGVCTDYDKVRITFHCLLV